MLGLSVYCFKVAVAWQNLAGTALFVVALFLGAGC